MRAATTLAVEKMHGTQNAFLVIDERPPRIERYDELARALCARDGGFDGADGMLVIRDAPGFAAEMRIFNADGSEAEMCGNGVRCVVRYLAERGAGERFTVLTLAGPIGAEVVSRSPEFRARVDVGPVSFPNGCAAETLDALDVSWTFFEVSLGNPHAVIFVDDLRAVDLVALGRAFATDARFPNGTNVHLVHVLDARTIAVRHFERGVGLTQACGTGAVACAAAARRLHGTASPVTVRVPGGTLLVEWEPGAAARLTGPAQTLFTRTIAV
jgi:diaminopimelate epimerase